MSMERSWLKVVVDGLDGKNNEGTRHQIYQQTPHAVAPRLEDMMKRADFRLLVFFGGWCTKSIIITGFPRSIALSYLFCTMLYLRLFLGESTHRSKNKYNRRAAQACIPCGRC